MSKALVEEYLSQWVTQDGSGMLDPNDRKPPYLGQTLERSNNENPILFLVQAAIEFCEIYPEYKDQFKSHYERHMSLTEVEPGLHSRRPGDRFLIRQSKDNILAQSIGGWYFKSDYARKVYDFGNHHHFNYNVKNPEEWDLKCQLQGGDTGIVAFCAGMSPPPEETIWLSTGLAFTKAFNTADLKLKWIGLYKNFSKVDKLILAPGVAIHELRRGARTKWLGYYAVNHPFRRFVEGRE